MPLRGRRPDHRAHACLLGLVVSGLITTAARPAAADAAISAEIRIDQRITSTVSSDGSPYPAVAFDGENFLVVWIDSRHLETTSAVSTYAVYGARFDRSGGMLD